MSCKFETSNVKKANKKKKTMVKQNKQINDRNSNQVKAQKKENKEQTSKKKNHIRLKRKSKFKAKYIKRILKNNG